MSVSDWRWTSLPRSDRLILEAHDHVTVSGQSELQGFWDVVCLVRGHTLRKRISVEVHLFTIHAVSK